MPFALLYPMYGRLPRYLKNFLIAHADHAVVGVHDQCSQWRIASLVRFTDHLPEDRTNPVVEQSLGADA
ncbi:hypothetical protein K377_03876 [Streptomyces sp. PsTaAH-137]|nr:hypothetical protein K377_03876 [Streptomyces sp. PsTaAH-137]